MSFGGTVGLVARMGSQERRMVLQFPVYSQDNGEGPQINVESSSVENLWYQTTVGQGNFVPHTVFAGTRT